MVVRALIALIAPSNRGLKRDETTTTRDAREWINSLNDDLREDEEMPALGDRGGPRRAISFRSELRIANTKLKKKRFRAVACLTSLAADVDLLTDWFFYFDTLANDNEYRAEFLENPVEGELPYLIPPDVMWVLLFVCIIGTFMWLILATDGAIIAPLLRRIGVEKLSMGYALFLCVLIEDIPQVMLTFLVEDYYEEDHQLSNFAVCNVVASLYDTLIQLAEAYDERQDYIETGVWCKESISAHNDTVTAIVALPIPDDNGDSENLRDSRIHVPIKRRRTKRGSLIGEEVHKNGAETELPRLRFLSASLDKTVQLWDIPAEEVGNRNTNQSIRTFRHLKGATCIVFLGKKDKLRDHLRPPLLRQQLPRVDDDAEVYFLSGSRSGRVKLWNLKGQCLRNYYKEDEKRNSVSSAAVVNEWQSFVSGYESGIIRLWGLWTGYCLAEYRGHSRRVSAVCSLGDNSSFLSASSDASIRLWDTSEAMQTYRGRSLSRDDEESNCEKDPDDLVVISSYSLDDSQVVEQLSKRTFIGHKGGVLSLCCVHKGIAFLSGGKDRTCRLWSVESGVCLRVFEGHTAAVTAVATVDEVTFLTGSMDKTIKIWDAVKGESLRTYKGHTAGVTDVSMVQNGTFVSSSIDRTIKLWIFTAVTPYEPPTEDAFNDMLNINIQKTSCYFDKMCTIQEPLSYDDDNDLSE